MMLKLMFDLVGFLVQWLNFYFHLGESILLLALIYYLLPTSIVISSQVNPVDCISFRNEPYIFSFLWADFSKFVSKHTISSWVLLFYGVIYHGNVWYLDCNANVCGYCRYTTFAIVTRHVGMNDPDVLCKGEHVTKNIIMSPDVPTIL